MTEPGASSPVAFIGLGMMGLPMAMRLHEAGIALRVCDASETARDAFAKCGIPAFKTPCEAATGAAVVITMLPNSAVVREVALGENGIAKTLAQGSLIIDMSSSAPQETRALAAELKQHGLDLIDAPVSGGVVRARNGSLAIMVGGDPQQVDRARPLLTHLGSSIIPVGDVGCGHAAKALNNYVSAAGLSAACEALAVAQAFGLDPSVLVDVLNQSTGKNNSTEIKLKPFILSGSFSSGFSMALMAKDLSTAAQLAESLPVTAKGISDAALLWNAASARLGSGADHTEIYRYLADPNSGGK